MRHLLFSIRDSAAEYYADPIYARTRAEAIRALGTAVQDPKHPFAQHPEHYALFELGSFDPQTGKIELHVQPVHVLNAVDLSGGDS